MISMSKQLGIDPEYICESCHLQVKGRIPGVQRIIIKVVYYWAEQAGEEITFTTHDDLACVSHIGDIITEFIKQGPKHKRLYNL